MQEITPPMNIDMDYMIKINASEDMLGMIENIVKTIFSLKLSCCLTPEIVDCFL